MRRRTRRCSRRRGMKAFHTFSLSSPAAAELGRYVANGVRVMSSESEPRLFTNRWAKEAAANTVPHPLCHCLERKGRWPELKVHTEQQDTASPGWLRLLELIEQAANDKCEE